MNIDSDSIVIWGSILGLPIFPFFAYFPFFEILTDLIHPRRVDSIEGYLLSFNTL